MLERWGKNIDRVANWSEALILLASLPVSFNLTALTFGR